MVLSLCDSVCPVAIETTFPLSNFKTKHIFGILVERVTFLKSFGAPQAPPERGARGPRNLGRRRRPKFISSFLSPPKAAYADAPTGAPPAPQIFYIFFSLYSFTAAEGGVFPNGHRRHPNGGTQGAQRWRRRRHFPGGRGKSRRKREFASMFLNF